MIEINYRGIMGMLLIVAMLIFFLGAFMISAGCITAAKNTYKEVMKTPTPTPTPKPTPSPTPKPTPIPTPSSIPTLAAHFVDPFSPGERWEGQWFKWHRQDVQGINSEGKKDLLAGVIVYRHKFLDRYSWYNNAIGNYQSQWPSEGNRYFVVWIHEEMMGDNSSYDPSMWIFDETSFRLQIGNTMYAPDETHDPVNHILEFDNLYDFYNTVIAGPFAWDIRYSGNSPSTGGYISQRRGWLRWGPGNAVDGYVIFEVPKGVYEKDLLLSGVFAQFGDAYWRFAR